MDFCKTNKTRRKSQLGTRRKSILNAGHPVPSFSCFPGNEVDSDSQFKNPKDHVIQNKLKRQPIEETPTIPVVQEAPVKNLLSFWSPQNKEDSSKNVLKDKGNILQSKLCDNAKSKDDGNYKYNNNNNTTNNNNNNKKNFIAALETKEEIIHKTHETEIVVKSKCTLFKSLIDESPDDSFLKDIKPLSPEVVTAIVPPLNLECCQNSSVQTFTSTSDDHVVLSPGSQHKTLHNEFSLNRENRNFEVNGSNDDLDSSNLKKIEVLLETSVLRHNEIENDLKIVNDLMNSQRDTFNRIQTIINTLKKRMN